MQIQSCFEICFGCCGILCILLTLALGIQRIFVDNGFPIVLCKSWKLFCKLNLSFLELTNYNLRAVQIVSDILRWGRKIVTFWKNVFNASWSKKVRVTVGFKSHFQSYYFFFWLKLYFHLFYRIFRKHNEQIIKWLQKKRKKGKHAQLRA